MLLSKASYSAFRLYIVCLYMCSLGIKPTTFTLLTQCSTTEPQEHCIIVLCYCIFLEGLGLCMFLCCCQPIRTVIASFSCIFRVISHFYSSVDWLQTMTAELSLCTNVYFIISSASAVEKQYCPDLAGIFSCSFLNLSSPCAVCSTLDVCVGLTLSIHFSFSFIVRIKIPQLIL